MDQKGCDQVTHSALAMARNILLTWGAVVLALLLWSGVDRWSKIDADPDYQKRGAIVTMESQEPQLVFVTRLGQVITTRSGKPGGTATIRTVRGNEFIVTTDRDESYDRYIVGDEVEVSAMEGWTLKR